MILAVCIAICICVCSWDRKGKRNVYSGTTRRIGANTTYSSHGFEVNQEYSTETEDESEDQELLDDDELKMDEIRIDVDIGKSPEMYTDKYENILNSLYPN